MKTRKKAVVKVSISVHRGKAVSHREGRTEGRVETDSLKAQTWLGWVGRVCAVGVVERLQGSGERQPESTEAGEDDEWEGVSEDELSETTQDHQKAAEEEVDTSRCCSIAASASPAHQVTGERSQREQESDQGPMRCERLLRCAREMFRENLQWSWVTKGLAQVTCDLVLWREVELLEELWRDGNAARGLDLPQGSLGVVVGTKVIAFMLRQYCPYISTINLRQSLPLPFSKSFSIGPLPFPEDILILFWVALKVYKDDFNVDEL